MRTRLNVPKPMREFAQARAPSGEISASRGRGLSAQFTWASGKTHTAAALILEHLLPLAREGLGSQGVDSADVDLYLGTLEERVRSGQTGAQWALKSLAALDRKGTRDMRMRSLTEEMFRRQQTGEPVHRWPLVEGDRADDWPESYRTVGQFMSTDLFTVGPDDLVDLAASVMDWQHVRHVPVEDEEGRLVGLLSHRDLLRLLSRRGAGAAREESVTVREIMKPNPVTVGPQTPTLEAIDLMRARGVGCLPVVERGQLVGIVTAHDFLAASARLFEERLRESSNASD
jgi:CBS domain-containing protein